MNTQFIKPIITAWLVLATNSLQAWQGAETDGGNTVESPATTPQDPFSFSPNEPGVLDKQVQTDRVVGNTSIMITWSENRDELRGFSNVLGEWEVLKIDKQDSIIPIVSHDLSAVRVGDSIAAFSGVKGWWDVIVLSKDSAAQPTISYANNLVQIEDNGHLYTFAAAKGRWTSPTDPDLQPIHDQIDVQVNPKAVLFAEGPFQKWLESLPKYKARGVRAQFSGSGFVDLYVERRSQLDEARAGFSRALKRAEEIVAAQKAPSSVLDVAEAEKRITDLRGELQQLELAVHAGSGTKDSPGAKQEVQQRELRKLVEKSFDLRQQMQRLEAQRMQLKLQTIEANLDAREKSRERIIERRIEQLSLGRLAFAMPYIGGTESYGVQLLAFTASYCKPCQWMDPVMQRMESDQFPVRMIDITEEPDLTRRHKIGRIPTFVLTVRDKEVKRFIGLTSEKELRAEMINAAMRLAESLSKNSDPTDAAQLGTETNVAEEPESRLPTDPKRFASEPASSGTRAIPGSNAASQWPQPAEIVKDLRKRMQVVKYNLERNERQQQRVEQWSRPLEQLQSEGIATPEMTEAQRLALVDSESKTLRSMQSMQSTLETGQREWNRAWAAYQSKLRLLRLDLEEAKLALESLTVEQNRMQQLAEKGAIPKSDLQKTESSLAVARINVQRAEEMLKLYADIEIQEPTLNPESLKSEK